MHTLALTWDDIDIERGEIHVHTARHFEGNASVDSNTTKNGESRIVPIFPPLMRAFETVPLPPVSNLVCTSADGKPVTSIALKRNWKTLLNTLSNIVNHDTKYTVSPGRRSDKDKERYKDAPRVEIRFRTHDLRHTFCTILYDAGVDVKTAQALMGHKTLEMTMAIYTHLSESKKKQSVDLATEYTKKYLSQGGAQN